MGGLQKMGPRIREGDVKELWCSLTQGRQFAVALANAGAYADFAPL